MNNRNFLAIVVVIFLSSWGMLFTFVHSDSEGSIELLIAPAEGFRFKLNGSRANSEEPVSEDRTPTEQ